MNTAVQKIKRIPIYSLLKFNAVFSSVSGTVIHHDKDDVRMHMGLLCWISLMRTAMQDLKVIWVIFQRIMSRRTLVDRICCSTISSNWVITRKMHMEKRTSEVSLCARTVNYFIQIIDLRKYMSNVFFVSEPQKSWAICVRKTDNLTHSLSWRVPSSLHLKIQKNSSIYCMCTCLPYVFKRKASSCATI